MIFSSHASWVKVCVVDTGTMIAQEAIFVYTNLVKLHQSLLFSFHGGAFLSFPSLNLPCHNSSHTIENTDFIAYLIHMNPWLHCLAGFLPMTRLTASCRYIVVSGFTFFFWSLQGIRQMVLIFNHFALDSFIAIMYVYAILAVYAR